jgi:hypothetical protein
MIAGIKVDKGAKSLAGFPSEKITEGLDGLRERLAEYATLGARFTKWRAVLTIEPQIPSRTCVQSNVEALARFAALSQEAGLVPIVEPEVLMDGDHTIERHYEVTENVLQALFQALAAHQVHLEGLLLKVNMILPGTECSHEVGVTAVAEATWRCMQHTVPAAVPGIVFLSGGQSDVRATEHLNALNQINRTPWQLSFSYGRALQAPALKAWAGREANVPRGAIRAAAPRPLQFGRAIRTVLRRNGTEGRRMREILEHDVAVLDAIFQRRSVRKYSSRPVEKDVIDQLLAAAVQAPSAMNQQPWAFGVFHGHERLRHYSERAKQHLVATYPASFELHSRTEKYENPSYDLFHGADTLIVVYAKMGRLNPNEDCCLAAQNLMLAAHAFGLGTCAIGFARPVV